MCRLRVNQKGVSIEDLDTDELKYLYKMINSAGLVERRIFNKLKTDIKENNLC